MIVGVAGRWWPGANPGLRETLETVFRKVLDAGPRLRGMIRRERHRRSVRGFQQVYSLAAPVTRGLTISVHNL